MATLPDNWESDYNGESERWFYRYKPTGYTQYTFPKPGDEYPEYIDSFSPPPELSPEERLESHYQVKRRNTAGGSSPAKNKKGNGLTSATMSGPADDDGNFWYQPDGLMFMGPGGYTDVSPEADEDERLQGFGGPATDSKQKDANKGQDVSPPGGSSNFISPAISAETTPMAGITKPATATPVLEKIETVYEADTGQAQAAAPESPEEVPLLDGRRIYSPVGYMAELPSEHTAQCRHETHPDPVELPTQYHMTQAVAQPSVYAYSDAFNMAAAELPADQSPVTRHVHAPASSKPDQKVLVAPGQGHPHPQPTSSQGYAPANPFHVHQTPVQHHYPASLSIAHQPQLSVVASQSPTTQYHPYNPSNRPKPAPAPHDNPYSTAHRQAQENVPPDHFNRYSQVVPEDVPAVLRPPQVPPKRPISQHDNKPYMIPGSNSRHESISDPSHQPQHHPTTTSLDQHGSRLVPSVLQPGGGRVGPTRPSPKDHQAHSTPDYRPYHPYEDLEKQIDNITRLYSPPPPHDKQQRTRPVLPDTSQSYSGSTGQPSLDITPGINRANTLPTDMPALPFMGADSSRGVSQGQPIAELAHQPRDSVSTIQEGQEAVFRDYSSSTVNNQIFPPALKTSQNQPASNTQPSPFHALPTSSATSSQTPDVLHRPSLPYQNPSQFGMSTSFGPQQGQSYSSQVRPDSTQQFHTWQQPTVSSNPVQNHPPRPLSVQSLQNPSTVRPETVRRPPHPEPKPPPHAIQRDEIREKIGSERPPSSPVGASPGAIPPQQGPAIPDRKYRIQSVDSAATAATTTRSAAPNRRVSLSNPSHGFIVENSAMPPPSVQSLRNEGSSRPNSPSPPPGSGMRPGAATARPRPMSMQFPSTNSLSNNVTQPNLGPYKPTIPPPGIRPSAMQPPRSASPFHQFAQTSGSRGSVSAYAQVAGQGEMRTTASDSPPPQSWQTSNRPPAIQRHQSPSPAQGGSGPVPRPVPGTIPPQGTNQLAHTRNTGTERSDRLPTPKPVPLPQPTPPTPQQGVSGNPKPTGQARRIPQPVPVPVPQPSPVPRPAPSQNPHPGQAPPRPDKKPEIGAPAQAAKGATSPALSTRVQTPLAVVAGLQPSAMSKPQMTSCQSVQPPQPTPNIAQRHAATPSSSQGMQGGTRPTKPPPGRQPQAPPSHSRNTERAGAGSQTNAIAPMDSAGVTAPPHIQQPPRLAQPPHSVVGQAQATGHSNVGANPSPMPPPSIAPTQHVSVAPPPSANNQQQAAFQQPPGVFYQNQMLNQPLGPYIPHVVPGPNNTQQIVYMTSAGGPQPIHLPHVTTATQGPIVSQGSPVVMAANQPPQPTSSPVSSPHTSGPGTGKEKDKERWFGKVFKSSSVKKQQNPVTAAAQTPGTDTANKNSGEKTTTEGAGRNKLQKTQPGAVQPQPTQPDQNAFTQTASPVAGAGIPVQAMPFVQGSNLQLAQHSGPYFQPVGGALYWNNQLPNTTHVVQQDVQQGIPQQQEQQRQPVQHSAPALVAPANAQKNPSQAETRRQSDSIQQSPGAGSQQQQQQQQPLQHSTVTTPPVVLQKNPAQTQTQTQPRRESNPSQQYAVASPYQQQQPNINPVYQMNAAGGGQFYQPQYGMGQHRQSFDQSHGYFNGAPSVGQTNTGIAAAPAQFSPSANEPSRRPSEPSLISAPQGSVSVAGEANPRRPSEPTSISGPRGSISNNTEVAPDHGNGQSQGQGQSQGFGGWGGGNQPQQQQPPRQFDPVKDQGQEQASRDSSSRKSISSSIAPSFTNSITDDSAFTTAPRRGDTNTHADVAPHGGDSSADDADPYVSAARSRSSNTDTNSNTGGGISVSNNASSTVAVPAFSVDVYSNSATGAPVIATTTEAPIATITPAPAPAPPDTASATTPTPTTMETDVGSTASTSAPQISSYSLAAQRADQLWGSKAKSNGRGTSTNPGNGPIVSAIGSPASSVREEASLASSPEGSPRPPAATTAAATSASTHSAAAVGAHTEAAANTGSSSGANTAAAAAEAAAKDAERSKWVTSEYDGSGWGDEEEDGYGYDYGAGYGYGGGYR